MSEFTKGPWDVDRYYWGGSIPDDCKGEWDTQNKSVMAGPDSICMVQGNNGKPMEANARLISAAPDMYEALRKFKEDWCNLNGHMKASTLDSIDAALSKATGESTDAPGA